MATWGTLAAATAPMALSSMRRDSRPLFARLHESWAITGPPPEEGSQGRRPRLPGVHILPRQRRNRIRARYARQLATRAGLVFQERGKLCPPVPHRFMIAFLHCSVYTAGIRDSPLEGNLPISCGHTKGDHADARYDTPHPHHR